MKNWPIVLAGALAVLAASAANAETIKVTIKGMKFTPAEIAVHVGDTVEWANEDFVTHTATAKDKAWDVVIGAGKTGTLTITKAGDVDYFCRFHPNMKAKLSAAE